MENPSQDQVTVHSEKRIEFSILESDPNTDSEMSGSDFEETTRRSKGRHIRFVPEKLTEHTISTIETQQPARAIRKPKSRTAKAVENPARARSSTPKSERAPERASKRKRGLEPSNQGLPMDTAPASKRARKYTVPCKAPNAAALAPEEQEAMAVDKMDAVVGNVVKTEEEERKGDFTMGN